MKSVGLGNSCKNDTNAFPGRWPARLPLPGRCPARLRPQGVALGMLGMRAGHNGRGIHAPPAGVLRSRLLKSSHHDAHLVLLAVVGQLDGIALDALAIEEQLADAALNRVWVLHLDDIG